MLITMSEKDIHRFKVLTDVREKRLRQVDAAIILNLSARHIRRLVNKLVSLALKVLHTQRVDAPVIDATQNISELKY
ncbi:hypothetical protein QF117_04510 [Vibrio sp. YMD68]|uniref:hypothetical protein n=1 Tax=Vibrio sp. YMD68 TaxID=3042300 RepID=UPI00249AE0C3|nr:hypothetical protein [Vibrio sp. YMD68]WGV98125.1 hypothetical protein QF117_04510 [Vibrio sp. YMD68]